MSIFFFTEVDTHENFLGIKKTSLAPVDKRGFFHVKERQNDT